MITFDVTITIESRSRLAPDDTVSLSPTMLHELRFSDLRYASQAIDLVLASDASHYIDNDTPCEVVVYGWSLDYYGKTCQRLNNYKTTFGKFVGA